MNAIIERIKEAYHFKTDAEVAKFLGIKPSTLSMQKNRGRLNLKRIIEKCSDLNQNWLLHGKGKKRITAKSNGIPIYSDIEVSGSTLDFNGSSRVGNLYAEASDEIKLLSGSAKNIIGLIAPSDAMAPTIHVNDVAIIDLKKDPADDAIFLISSARNVLLRRLRKIKGSFVAKSDNGTHDSITISSNNGYQLLGKLIWVLRRV